MRGTNPLVNIAAIVVILVAALFGYNQYKTAVDSQQVPPTAPPVESTIPPTASALFTPIPAFTPETFGGESTPNTCTSTVYAIDPGQGSAYGPANSWYVYEVVNFNAKTINIYYFFSQTPVRAYIEGEVHHNLWYGYCDLQSAMEGALTQFEERSSESKIVGGWAYGMTVYAPVQNYPFGQ